MALEHVRDITSSTAYKHSGKLHNISIGCVLVIAFAGLAACSRTTANTAGAPMTVVFEPAPGGVNPPLPATNSEVEACTSAVEVLRVDAPPPTGLTATFSSTELGITLQYPAAWQPGNLDVQMYARDDIDLSGQPLRTLQGKPVVYSYRGDDGYFSVSGAALLEPSATTVCEAELRSNLLKQNRYGQHPVLENLVIDGQSACLIMPSDDQPASEQGRALLVWQHPDAAVRSRTQRPVLVLIVADKRHIRDLGASLKFTGPGLPWTPDPSTPAPPAREVKHFVSEYGVGFDYPANWFTDTQLTSDSIMIQNAPAESAAAIMGSDGFLAISVELKPEDARGYTSTLAFVGATLLWRLPKENVLSVEVLPPLPQGYEAVRVTQQHVGEEVDLYVRNGARVVRLFTIFPRGTRSAAKYLEVLDQIASTLVIP